MSAECKYACCDSSSVPTTSFSFNAEYMLDAEGTFYMDNIKPYKRHVPIVELLGSSEEGTQKLVHVSDVVSAPWVMGMWRHTLTKSEFLDHICVNRKMEKFCTTFHTP